MDDIKLIDVGARGGISSRWKPYFDKIDVLGFEPDPVECESLNRQKWPYKVRYLPHALGAANNEQATLHITKAPGCSSLLKPNLDLCLRYPYGENFRVVREYPMTLCRLDSVCSDFRPDVIKIDTQGTELSILQGAGDLLSTTIAVELEVEFLPLYIDQPLFSDIDVFMRSKGFEIRGLRRTTWREKANYTHAFGGQLVHGDALYFRRSLLDSETGHAILAAYRQYDLLALYGATHLIPADSPLLRLGRKIAGRFDGRSMRGWLNQLRPATDDDWHDHDFF